MRYAESHPDALAKAFASGSVAVLPIGALEWHGAHLPLGLDLIVAEYFTELLSREIGGVLLPPLVTPVTTLPHPMSLQVATEGFRVVIDDTLAGLARAGAQTIAVVTGHYAQGHEIELYEAAMRAMDDSPNLRVFAASPLEPLGKDELLDHAALVETSLLLAIRPDLVKLDALQEHEPAVLGADPRSATPEYGRTLLDQGAEAWKAWLKSDSSDLFRWYGTRFDAYQPYVDAYFSGSWEEAIVAWWSARNATLPS